MRRFSWRTSLLVGSGILMVLWLSPWILCGLQMAYEMPTNSLRLWFFGKELFEYPLPPQTEELSRQTEVGLLVGNSNHCDYLAERILATWLSAAEIEFHFRSLNIEMNFDEVRMPDGRLRVTLRRFSIGHLPGADIRCH